jgi:putative CocE/NonD family hydrolase
MSTKPNVLTAFLLVPLLTTCITAQIPDASGSSNYGIADFRNIMVPMCDGVRLAMNVYRPAENGKVVEGKFPVILERTPYGKDNDVDYANHWVKQGYVVILQDVRGRFNSEGVWRFFRDDINDGYDTAKWIDSQPWCSCAIGTVGGSYPGGTQHALAISNPPSLKAMIPAYATSDAGRVGLRHNGAFELRWLNWIFNLFEPEGDRDGAKNKQAMAKLGERCANM